MYSNYNIKLRDWSDIADLIDTYKAERPKIPPLELFSHNQRAFESIKMAKEAGVSLSMGWRGTAGVDVPEGFAVIDAPVTITHEEHNPVELPPGYYMVRIVREFDHIAGRSQYVAD